MIFYYLIIWNALNVKKNLEDSNFCSRCGFDISQFQLKQCSICLEKTKNQEILICGHSFCPGCIEIQYTVKPECPECRTKIKNALIVLLLELLKKKGMKNVYIV